MIREHMTATEKEEVKRQRRAKRRHKEKAGRSLTPLL
jgi:hypothetical protein